MNTLIAFAVLASWPDEDCDRYAAIAENVGLTHAHYVEECQIWIAQFPADALEDHVCDSMLFSSMRTFVESKGTRHHPNEVRLQTCINAFPERQKRKLARLEDERLAAEAREQRRTAEKHAFDDQASAELQRVEDLARMVVDSADKRTVLFSATLCAGEMELKRSHDHDPSQLGITDLQSPEEQRHIAEYRRVASSRVSWAKESMAGKKPMACKTPAVSSAAECLDRGWLNRGGCESFPQLNRAIELIRGSTDW